MVAGYIVSQKDEKIAAHQARKRLSSLASSNGEQIIQWMESGNSAQAAIDARSLLDCMSSGDSLYVDDITSLGSTFKELIFVLSEALKRGISIHGVNDGYSSKAIEDQATYIQALNHMGKAYSMLVSNKTKAALNKKKNAGERLGRPDGSCVKMRILIKNNLYIRAALENGESISSLCSRYNVSRSTFRRFMKNAGIK